MVRRSASRNPSYLRNNILSEFAIELRRVLDLTDPSVMGLTTADLTGPDHGVCQAIAEAALARGCDALLVPSAALPGSNLVIFPQNLTDPPPIRVVRGTELPLDAIAEERREGEQRA